MTVSNCILGLRQKTDAEFGITDFVPANKFLDLCASPLNYKHMAFLGGLWSPSKPSCWGTRMSFSFQRSQSRYPVSRGWKSRNIWYSSKWKHLHCHLFSFLLLSCWMWITQRPPSVSAMAVYMLQNRVLQNWCALPVALEVKHVFSTKLPWTRLSAFPMQPYAETCSGVKNTWEPFFLGSALAS